MNIADICKFDQKNRIHIPMRIFEAAEFKENGSCFVTHEAGSKSVTISTREYEPRENAGYTIVRAVRIGESEFVAGENKSGEAVTWQYSDIGGYFWGHYFDNIQEALADLYRRAEEECRVKADIYEERAKQ